MLRCAVLTAALLCCSALPVAAQVLRNFPPQSLRGEIVVVQPPALLLNGRPAHLAPGARLHGADGMLKVSGALTGGRRVVNYTLDGQGQVSELWVLTDGELARRPWPVTPEQSASWRFDPVSQTWSRP